MTQLLRVLLTGLLLSACVQPSPPVLEDATLALGNLGYPYQATLVAAGGDGALSYGVRGGGFPPGLTLSGDGALSGTPTGAGTFTFTVVVKDASGQSDTGVLSLEILGAPPPGILEDGLESAAVGTPYASTLSAEGGTQPYTWTATGLPAGLSLGAGGALGGTPTVAGTYSVTASLVDARGQTDQGTLTLVVHPALAISTGALPDAYTDAGFSQALEASGGVAPYSWTVTAGALPTGLGLTSSGLLSGTPSVEGDSALTFTVTDAGGQQASRVLPLTVLQPPAVVTGLLASGLVGSSYSQPVEVAGGRAPLTLTLTGTPPPGLTWDGTRLAGTPSATGSAALTFTVEDANGRSTSRELTLSVYDSLAVTTPSLPTAYASSAYSTLLSAIGGSAPYSFALSAGSLPAGISLATSGTLSGTTATTGDFPITVRVTDQEGLTATRALVFKVRPRVLILTEQLPDAYRGSSYSHAILASGGEGNLSWTLTSGNLPSGLSLSFSGALSGTVDAAASTASLTVSATDVNGRYDARAFDLAVFSPPVFGTTSLPGGTVGAAYAQTLQVSGGKAPLQFSVLSGDLPPGLSLDALSGQLSGSPSTAGSYSFTVEVEDANGRAQTQALTLEVAPGGGASALLEVASWNIEWFGATGNGPSDENLQLTNAARVITETGAEAWGVAEIVDTTHFNSLVSSLSGFAGFLSNHASVTDGSAYYTASEQKLGFVYDTSKVQVHSASLILTGYASYEFAGRPPLRVDTTVTVDGNAVDLTFIVVHLKAMDDTTSRTRREAASAALKAYLDSNLATAEVMVLGDWNDDVDESITPDGSGGFLQTPFQNFLDDPTDYRFLTQVLTNAGQQSTVYYDNVIDHHLATNELTALQSAPSQIVRPDLWTTPVSSYGSSTSDHYPVLSRFDLTGQGGGGGGGGSGETPQLIINEILHDEPGAAITENFPYEFVEIRNVGATTADLSGWTLADHYAAAGSTVTRHAFTGTLAPGAAVVVFGGSAALSGAPPNAVAASTGTLSLHPTDELRLVDPSGAIHDSASWSTTYGDGISFNREVDGDGESGWVAHTALSAQDASPGIRADGSAW